MSTPRFCRVRIARSLVFCVVYCRSLFVLFLLVIVLSVLFLLVIILSVLFWLMASDYPFLIDGFWLLFFDWWLLITLFWLMASDYSFHIFKLFLLGINNKNFKNKKYEKHSFSFTSQIRYQCEVIIWSSRMYYVQF